MARALSLLAKTALSIAALFAASPAATANGASEPGRKSTNTFNLVYAATAPTPVVVPGAGASVAPSKPVVSNPYHVPLIQNAGSLRPGR